jgi:hypothetical protein
MSIVDAYIGVRLAQQMPNVIDDLCAPLQKRMDEATARMDAWDAQHAHLSRRERRREFKRQCKAARKA